MSDWFLPTAERPWTAGNLVVPHVHGADYFARLLEVIGATEPGTGSSAPTGAATPTNA